jgi:hypothetical protein
MEKYAVRSNKDTVSHHQSVFFEAQAESAHYRLRFFFRYDEGLLAKEKGKVLKQDNKGGKLLLTQ